MSSSSLVLGVDSSTQSCKSLLVDAETGAVVDSGRAPHPEGTQVDPRSWCTALSHATDELLPRAAAVAVGGQQHGMVALDAADEVVRDAMLWNDTSSAPQATRLVDELGGPRACVEAIGSVVVASLTISKLRWMRDVEPENAARTERVLLPHDYLTWDLGGREEFTTDHGDASGTGYYSPARRRWLPDLARLALGRPVELPRIAGPHEVVGTTAGGALIAAGTGDNMAAALGLGLGPGDVCVSLGTSGVAMAVVDRSVHDSSAMVTGFADATGRYLPLACTLNGARVLDLGATLLGTTQDEFAALALQAPPGSHGLTVLPYLDGERTPNRPYATGVLRGLTTAASREDLARAIVEGLLCSMRDAIAALENATAIPTRRILLIGGASRSEAVRRIAPQVFGVPVHVPEAAEYVARGAARQAAWALAGTAEPPEWPAPPSVVYRDEPRAEAIEQYASLRDATTDWGTEAHGPAAD